MRSWAASPRGPDDDAPRYAGCHPGVAFAGLVEADDFRDRGRPIDTGFEAGGKSVQNGGGRDKIALQRVDTDEAALIVIEIGKIEAHLALSAGADLDQAAANGEAG